jgi:hypothetical protein
LNIVNWSSVLFGKRDAVRSKAGVGVCQVAKKESVTDL